MGRRLNPGSWTGPQNYPSPKGNAAKQVPSRGTRDSTRSKHPWATNGPRAVRADAHKRCWGVPLGSAHAANALLSTPAQPGVRP